jgi:hypothetical protein
MFGIHRFVGPAVQRLSSQLLEFWLPASSPYTVPCLRYIHLRPEVDCDVIVVGAGANPGHAREISVMHNLEPAPVLSRPSKTKEAQGMEFYAFVIIYALYQLSFVSKLSTAFHIMRSCQERWFRGGGAGSDKGAGAS